MNCLIVVYLGGDPVRSSVSKVKMSVCLSVLYLYSCSCWVDQPVFYYAFMLPVGLIIVVNTVLFTLVVKGITCDRPKNIRSTQSGKDLALLQCRAAVCCFIILGKLSFKRLFALESFNSYTCNNLLQVGSYDVTHR